MNMERYNEMNKQIMEEEMNRFEEEISKPILRNDEQSFQNLNYPRRQTPFQFIPHSIQRQLPSSAKPILHPPAQSSSSSSTIQSPPINVEKPPYKAMTMPINNTLTSTNQVNYTVTPLGLPPGVTLPLPGAPVTGSSSGASSSKKHVKTGEASTSKNKKILRVAGGQVWEDSSLLEWNLDDFRLFCGDLGNDVSDDVLTRGFSKYPSFLKAKVIRDKRTNKSKGYGFVSFKDPQDYMRAMKEMDGKYLGSRPIKLRKSTWKDRSLEMVKKKQKEKAKFKF